MYDIGFSSLAGVADDGGDNSETRLGQNSTSRKKEERIIKQGDFNSYNDTLTGNFIGDYGIPNYSDNNGIMIEDYNSNVFLNTKNSAENKFGVQEYPLFDYGTSKTQQEGGYDIDSMRGVSFPGKNKVKDFGFGLDALIHGGQFGFGPQPSFLVATPFFVNSRRVSEEVSYELDSIENATISADPSCPRKRSSTPVPISSREKSDNSSNDKSKGKPKPIYIPTGDKNSNSSNLYSPRQPLASKREAFAREAKGYMQEVGFILNQLFGENENFNTHGGGNLTTSSGHNVRAADLEALITGDSFPITNSTTTTTGMSTPTTTTSGNIKDFRRQNEVLAPWDEKNKYMEMEYPVFDNEQLRDSLIWPNNILSGGREKNSRSKKSDSSSNSKSNVGRRRRYQEIKHSQQKEEESRRLSTDEIMDCLEYPTLETISDSTAVLMKNLAPLFPEVTHATTGAKHFTAPTSNTPALVSNRKLSTLVEKASGRKLEEHEWDDRTQEQRIVEARRQAADKSLGVHDSKIVVIDNRFTPKTNALSKKPDSGILKRLEAQQKEDEERRARVQAFLERRHSRKKVKDKVVGQVSNKEKSERKIKTPKKSQNSIQRKVSAEVIVTEELTEALISPLQRVTRQANLVRSLVIIYGGKKNLGNKKVKINLESETTVEIRQPHELSRFFEVDEYLEYQDNNNLYSITLVNLRRKFLSGLNVAMFLTGSESARLVSWRSVREVMAGVFQDINEKCELFASVALVRQGLTQDLLSESGRMVRTTFNFSPLLDVSLDNVSYTKVKDLRHFSKLLAHGWESARFHQTHDPGFIAVSVILKQIKNDDLILSSMLVTSGNSSVNYINGVLKKDEDEPYTLFDAALGGSCFTVAVLALCEEDEGIVQLMNTQRKITSVTNKPGTIGSFKAFIENAEKELDKYKTNDKEKFGRRKFLLEQITLVKRALLDPKGYIPREDIEQLQKRHQMRSKAKLESNEQPISPPPKLEEKRPSSAKPKAEEKQGNRKLSKHTNHSVEEDHHKKSKAPSPPHPHPHPHVSSSHIASSTSTKTSTATPTTMKTPKTVLSGGQGIKNKSPAILPKVVPIPKAPSLHNIHPETHQKHTEEGKEIHLLPVLRNNPTSSVKQIRPGLTTSSPLVNRSNGKGETGNINLVERRKGRRRINSPVNFKEEKLNVPINTLSNNQALSKEDNKGNDNEDYHSSSGQKRPPSKEPLASTEVNSTISGTSILLTKKQLSTTMHPTARSGHTFTDVNTSSKLSDSATVGPTVSTRYIGRVEVPIQKPVFLNLEANSKHPQLTPATEDVRNLKPEISTHSAMTPHDINIPRVSGSEELKVRGQVISNTSNPSTLIAEQEEYVEEEEEEEVKRNNNIDIDAINEESYDDNNSEEGEDEEDDDDDQSIQSKDLDEGQTMGSATLISSKVRTLVVLDPRCNETANVTHDNTMIVAMTDDDFEEYEVDEVIERPDGCESMHSKVVNELRDTFLLGCNAAILAADSRSSAVSSLVLKSVVRDVLTNITDNSTSRQSHHKGAISVSIVQLKGESALDLLKEKSTPQKMVIAISPIFGPCVHNVSRLPVNSAVIFDSLLTSALTRAVENEREYGMVFVSLVLKQKLESENDVLVSSLIASLVGENVGLYAAVLDRSPLVPRALFHYALGGPCCTLALLSFSGDETRTNQMLAVQKRLGETTNRPTHRGSINKFISGIRNDLAPSLREKLRGSDDGDSTQKILHRLEEMVQDAEALLKNFEESEPRAYLNDAEPRKASGNRVDRKPPLVTLTGSNDGEKVPSLVFVEQRLLGNGSIAVQGNSILARIGELACRYDVDEVVVRESGSNSLPSQLIDDIVLKFLSGHSTALLAADSRNSAVTPLILRKIAYLILYNMSMESQSSPVRGDLLVSMSLIKDDVTVDLLAVDEDLTFHRFEVDVSPLFGRRLRGASYHYVESAESFDHLLAVAVDRAEPALRSEDPGVMVVSLSLTQYIDAPQRDVLISSFMATTVFDSVSHYTGILQDQPGEPTELFKLALGGPCFTIAMLGLSDEDWDAGRLLSVQMELAHVRNPSSRPMSVVQHIIELKKGIAILRGHLQAAGNEQQMENIRAKIAHAEYFLREAQAILQSPLRERGFVPLGSQM